MSKTLQELTSCKSRVGSVARREIAPIGKIITSLA